MSLFVDLGMCMLVCVDLGVCMCIYVYRQTVLVKWLKRAYFEISI